MAWCIEVLEHIARPYMYNYQTIFHKAAIIVASHSAWGGHHHVEVHPDWWWITRTGPLSLPLSLTHAHTRTHNYNHCLCYLTMKCSIPCNSPTFFTCVCLYFVDIECVVSFSRLKNQSLLTLRDLTLRRHGACRLHLFGRLDSAFPEACATLFKGRGRSAAYRLHFTCVYQPKGDSGCLLGS